MKIRLLAEYPMPIVFGGAELQCLKTLEALKFKLDDVSLLDYNDKKDDFDLIHIFGNPPGIFDILNHIPKNKKIVVSAICGVQYYSYKGILKKKAISNIAKAFGQKTDYYRLYSIFQKADHIICLNSLEKNYISKNFDIAGIKISVLPNGVEKYFFNAAPKLFEEKYTVNNFILFTGNIVCRKNPLQLARAIKQSKLTAVFIGGIVSDEIDYAKEFESFVANSQNILWIRGIDYDDPILPSAYAAASAFCLPSDGETQSLSALEAMAAGTPVILGDLPYAYQEPFTDCFKCNPKDIQSIKNSINNAIASQKKIKLSEEYTWENIAEKTIKIYEQVFK